MRTELISFLIFSYSKVKNEKEKYFIFNCTYKKHYFIHSIDFYITFLLVIKEISIKKKLTHVQNLKVQDGDVKELRASKVAILTKLRCK